MGERESKEPWQKAENWQQAALALGIITIVGVCFLIPWVLAASSDYGLYRRVQVAAAVAALGGAAVTFCTVNWRGFVATRQTEVAQAQLASADENNLALLLQKGAELLSGDGNRAHLAAAIATLQAVITAQNPKFVQEAMELIADMIDEKFQNDNTKPIFRAATKALKSGYERGYIANRAVDFSADESTTGSWDVFVGVDRLTYTGGSIIAYREDDYPVGAIRLLCRDVSFVECQFERVGYRFTNCRFLSCRIARISLTKNGVAEFHQCDFTGAKVTGSDVADVKFVDCYYKREAPPEFPAQWMEQLSVLDPV